MLSQMGGGYNVEILVDLLAVDCLAPFCADALKSLTKVYDSFQQVAEMAESHPFAGDVIASWSKAEWFTDAKELPGLRLFRCGFS